MTTTIQKSDIVTAQVLSINFAEPMNSYVIKTFTKKDNGDYDLHNDIWTNSSTRPDFTVGQTLTLIPITGTDNTKRLEILPV